MAENRRKQFVLRKKIQLTHWLRGQLRSLGLHAAEPVVYCGDHVVLTRLSTGAKIFLDMRDTSVAPSIVLGGGYESHVEKTLKAMLRPGDVVFDVGANFGYHSLQLSGYLRQRGGELHLFEPNPIVHRLLERSINANGLWGLARLNRAGLSSAEGVLTMTVYEDSWGGASLLSPEDRASAGNPWLPTSRIRDQFDVPTTTLDEYCRSNGVERIDLMKIDVEGHEDAVFEGAERMLEASSELRVVMEFTFEAYADASAFWNRLSDIFPFRFHIREQTGELVPVDSLADLKASCTKVDLADVLLCRMSPAP